MRRPGPTGSATTVTSGSLPVFYRTSPVQSPSASASCGQISQPCAIVPCSTAAILGLFRLNAENPQRFVLTIPSRRLASALPRISRSLERARPRFRPLIPPPRLAVRRNESPTLRFRAQSVPSRLPRSNSSSVSRGPCATRLHKRNAAGPRCPCPKRSHKAIPGCCASMLHKLGPATHQETSRKGSCAREFTHVLCQSPHCEGFADVFVRSDRKAESPGPLPDSTVSFIWKEY